MNSKELELKAKDLEPLLKALASWAAATTARQDALETVVKGKLNISDAEWSKALSDAKFKTQAPAQASTKIAGLAKFLEKLEDHS
jgi:uncharacterized protein HemY